MAADAAGACHVAQQQKFSRLNPFDQEERSVFNMVRATAASYLQMSFVLAGRAIVGR